MQQMYAPKIAGKQAPGDGRGDACGCRMALAKKQET